MNVNVATPLETLRDASRMTARQKQILDHLTIETPHLITYYLTEGGLPFDFRDIYYRLTGRFDYQSTAGGSLRRTLRAMVTKGLLVRGAMLADVAKSNQPENIQSVATWHIPGSFGRDCKLMKALPDIASIKHQEVTGKTPAKYVNTIFGSLKRVSNAWLEKPLVDWLDGKAAFIELPAWVNVPNPQPTMKQLQHKRTKP